MDIQTLKQLVKSGLKNGNYSLDTALLQSLSITAIAADYLPNGALQITPDPKTPIIEPPDGTSIIVKGTGIDSPFKALALEATFYIGSGGAAALTLMAKGDQDWTLDKSFGVFANNIGASLRFQGEPTPPTLSLLSDAQGKLDAGLSFDGTIDFSVMQVGIATLLGITSEEVKGPIILKNGASEFVSLALTGPDLADINLWLAKDLTVQFAVNNYTIINPTTKKPKPIPFVRLGASIPFSSLGKAHSLPVTTQVTNWDSDIRFVADISDVIDASLDELGQFVGGANLAKTLPQKSSFPIEKVLKFSELYMDIDAKGESVNEVGLQVVSTTPWTIVHIESTNKNIVATDVKLDFAVVTPFSKPTPYLDLGGVFQLTNKASLFVSAKYPNFEVLGYLIEGSVLNIADFIEQFVGPCNGIPDLSINTLYFDFLSGDYTFEIDVEGYWPINSDQSLLLIVEQLGFSVQYTSTPADLTANFSGMIRVASVDISIKADYTSEDGWLFSGKTGEEQIIPIGGFITYLTETFSIPAPPAWMQTLTLKNIGVTLNTTTKDFTFTVTADAVISDKACELVINFSLTHPTGSYALVLDGTLTVGAQTFTLDFEKTGTDTQMGVTWTESPGNSLSLQDIAGIFGNDSLTSILGEIPSDMDLALTSLSFTYDFTNHELVLTAVSKNYGALVFVATKPADAWVFVFLAVIGTIELTQLPLIGEEVGALGKFEIDNFNLLVCSGTIAQGEIKKINLLIAAVAAKTKATLPTLPDTTVGLQQGVNLSMTFQVASFSAPVAVGTATPKTGGSQTLALLGASRADGQVTSALMLADSANPQTQNGYWVNLQKAFGPVYMDKIGFTYADGAIEILFNFSLKLGALTITLDGLMVGSPLTKFDPIFGLQGLSITFNSGVVEISGGFIRQVVDGVTEYNGEALIKAGTFTLSAMGSYAKVNGETSMFIFALLDAPLGGPAFFFVTGLAAGFGYNRGLVIPTIDQIATFPLVSGFVPGQSSPFSGSDPGTALQVLVSKNIVPIQIGQNWLAAGIQFTSFEMLQSFALVVVEFGASLEIALLGMTTASIPTGDPRPLLFAQLAIEVRILPDDGLFAVDAKLTSSSYLLDQSCHLTGGFAFYLWFGSNTHAGDFVITLGGYHPNFNKPAHYPDVPRLGFNWVVTSELTIKGGMYFALTPVCLMAGGSLQALWQSGNLKAWFDIGADFLIAWKPYHYEIDVYISFGVSYTFNVNLLFVTITKTISVSLGADLSIWGPAFSGVAHIHLWIISFTVHFGASSSQTPPPIPWSEFEQSFFPAATNASQQQKRLTRRLMAVENDAVLAEATSYQVWTVSVTQGLVKNVAPGADNPDDIDWIVNPEGTVLQVKTLLPAKQYTIVVQGMDTHGKPIPVSSSQIVITNQTELDGINVAFGVGPSAVASDDFASAITVTLTYEDSTINAEQIFYFTAIIQPAPKALWLPGTPDITNKETLVTNVLLGFDITSGQKPPDETPWADISQLGFKDYSYTPMFNWATPKVVDGPAQPNDPFNQLQATIIAAPSRAGILASLVASGTSVNPNVDVRNMAAKAGDFLLAPPIFAFDYVCPS